MLASDWEERCENAGTDREKLDVVIEHLTEWHLDHLGGYPYAGMWIETIEGEKFIMAGLDPGKDYNRTMLEVYTRTELLDWFERARQLYKRWREEEPDADVDFSGALLEAGS